MSEFLSKEFTLEFIENTQKEFERFVEEIGEEIIERVSVNGKKKGVLYVGPIPLAKKETIIWQIDKQYIPIVWEALTSDYSLVPIEEREAQLDLSIAEDEKLGKQAWFALCDPYNGNPTPTLTHFAFALNDYLKESKITVVCKPCKKATQVTEIKYRKLK